MNFQNQYLCRKEKKSFEYVQLWGQGEDSGSGYVQGTRLDPLYRMGYLTLWATLWWRTLDN